MNNVRIGLIGYGTVGSGVAELLKKRSIYLKKKYGLHFTIVAACDLLIKKRDTTALGTARLTTNFAEIINDPTIDVVVELIGGLTPAKDIITTALKNGKHVVTANKAVISHYGPELFALAHHHNRTLAFETAVGAGVPIIKSITDGIVGNLFNGVFGIVNGTCNFILSQMTKKGCSFQEAVREAQERGYAESDPTLDTNGKDAAHKLAILILLAFNKHLAVKDIYTEGIGDISHDDIAYAETMGLVIKLLAIAKKEKNKIEARVHPTLISKDHPLAAVNGIYNAVYLDSDPLGKVMLSGEGAGKFAAASGIVSDLINLASQPDGMTPHCNRYVEDTALSRKDINDIKTKFYIRVMALDKPGVLSRVAGILGKNGISINSVNQREHSSAKAVPVVMLTDFATEKMLRKALDEIQKLPVVAGRPVAIRMETLQ